MFACLCRKVEHIGENSLRGVVLKVDKFGNLITNISEVGCACVVRRQCSGGQHPDRGTDDHAGVPFVLPKAREDEFFAIVGSSGYLEIAAKQASAAEKLVADVGTPIGVVVNPAR